MVKFEIQKKDYWGDREKIVAVYKVIGIRKERLLLELLEIRGSKKNYIEREKPSYKIYYDSRIGNFIKIDGEKIGVDKILKELFNSFYFKKN